MFYTIILQHLKVPFPESRERNFFLVQNPIPQGLFNNVVNQMNEFFRELELHFRAALLCSLPQAYSSDQMDKTNKRSRT